ncbi:MAG: nitrous oxide reductase accessory protein NosL [Calditerrivibrio sp.]|nr:nitrous oxide reductase accessory protein NosL [Calditerrivibrio sp.]
MKQLFILICALFFFTTVVYPQDFTKEAGKDPILIMKGPDKHWCPICGMSIKMYYKTSHGVYLKDGSTKQYCSIRCLLVDYPEIKDKITKTVVIDAKTEELIDAYKANYLIGSKIPGTMSKISKIAFAKKEDAEEFQKIYGGEIADFKKAFALANEHLKSDNEMTQKKKESEMYPMGEKLFKDKCIPDIEPSKYDRINELKADIFANKLCKDLNERQLQAVALYLWEVKRLKSQSPTSVKTIEIPKDAKCPVCGMFVYKYPKWAVEISYTLKNETGKLYFDGVKDFFKFFFNPEKWNKKYSNIMINSILVTDYYTQKAINAKDAYFIIGSNVIGPMGNELIPFEHESSAQSFLKDHNGKKILKFADITEKLVYDLDK